MPIKSTVGESARPWRARRTAGLYASFMPHAAIARRTFTSVGPKTALSSGSRTMLDVIYIVAGCAIFIAFGLYALALKRV